MTRRPAMFMEGSAWEMVAGDDTDDALPLEPGGVRFHRVQWNDAEDFTAGRIVLPERQADSIRPNILMDLQTNMMAELRSPLSISPMIRGVQEWDGGTYRDFAVLPASVDESGDLGRMRMTFELNPEIRFDYQTPVPGRNVFVQLTQAAAVHHIEARLTSAVVLQEKMQKGA